MPPTDQSSVGRTQCIPVEQRSKRATASCLPSNSPQLSLQLRRVCTMGERGRRGRLREGVLGGGPCLWEGDDWQRTKEKSNSTHCKKRSWMPSRPSCVLDGAYSLSFSITENTLQGCCCTTLCIAANAARIQTHHGVGAWRHRCACGIGTRTRAWMHAASVHVRHPCRARQELRRCGCLVPCGRPALVSCVLSGRSVWTMVMPRTRTQQELPRGR